jgi:hypothetical protein
MVLRTTLKAYLWMLAGAVAMIPLGFVLVRVFGIHMWQKPARPATTLSHEESKAVGDDAQRGRRNRDMKRYGRLLQKASEAAARGRDMRRADKKIRDAARLIQAEQYDLAEQLMSELEFYLTDFNSEAGSSADPAQNP